MKNIFEVTLRNVIVPSVNKKHKGASRFYVHQAHITDLLKLQHRDINNDPLPPCMDKVGIPITIITEKDIDNPLKALHDALEEAKIIVDDDQIWYEELIIPFRIVPGKKKGRDILRVEVWKLTRRGLLTLLIKYGRDLIHV